MENIDFEKEIKIHLEELDRHLNNNLNFIRNFLITICTLSFGTLGIIIPIFLNSGALKKNCGYWASVILLIICIIIVLAYINTKLSKENNYLTNLRKFLLKANNLGLEKITTDPNEKKKMKEELDRITNDLEKDTWVENTINLIPRFLFKDKLDYVLDIVTLTFIFAIIILL